MSIKKQKLFYSSSDIIQKGLVRNETNPVKIYSIMY